MTWLTPTPWQEDVLSVPESVSLFMAGGRGPGKTTAAQFDQVRHCTLYKKDARCLVVRPTLKSLMEFEDQLSLTLAAAFGQRNVKPNRSDHMYRLANGASVLAAPLESALDYSKLQGLSFSHIFADEVGEYPTLKWLNLLRSNLRAPAHVQKRVIWAANPGGRQHAQLQQRHVQRAAPWAVYEVDGREWTNCFGTLRDNPHLPPDYQANLFAACGRDRELLRAWAAMRELLFNSHENNGRPGMWVSDRCTNFWATVPVVPRDPVRPEDLDSSAVDHAADAARYAATHEPRITTWAPNYSLL